MRTVSKPLLSVKECLALKALCIIAIMTHNYLHVRGYAAENEFQYYSDRVGNAWNLMHNGGIITMVLHLLSFAGHYALFGFVFISGYGLVKKYEKPGQSLRRWQFIGSHYVKLVRLLVIPLIVSFIIFWAFRGHRPLMWHEALAEALLLGNFTHSIYPFVYWYLGMAMQLYLLYALVLHRRGDYPWHHQLMLAALVVGCGWAQMVSHPTGQEIYDMRINLVGYVGAFVMGIAVARHFDRDELRRWQWWGLALLGAILSAFCLNQYYTWIWIWLPCVLLIISLIKILPGTSSSPVVWLGAISSSLYITHPIVREVVISCTKHRPRIELLVYLVISIVLAAAYARLLKKWR